MGLKSGSRDAGLSDEEKEGEAETQSEPPVEQSEETDVKTEQGEGESKRPDTGEAQAAATDETTGEEQGRPSMSSLPYKLRRDKVNEGREQVPYFLREGVIEAESELQNELEELLGEKVYKSDYREAAMVVAQRNPELVAEVLREWGYDLE